jgi:transketolase
VNEGEQVKLIASGSDSLRDAFGRALVEHAGEFLELVVLDGDVAGGTGTHHFRNSYPERFIQTGIAEQNMVGISAGLAAAGKIPVVTTFASFMLRAIDHIRVGVLYPRHNVKLVASHLGLDVGPDGASAQCLEDLSIFRSLPDVLIFTPSAPSQMSAAVRTMLETESPVYMRTGRSPVSAKANVDMDFKIGGSTAIRTGADATLITHGATLGETIVASEILYQRGIEVDLICMHTVRPIDEIAVLRSAAKTRLILTIEDHSVVGGLGSAVAELVSEKQPTKVLRLGTNLQFGESGNPRELYVRFGLSGSKIAERAEAEVLEK